MRVEKRDAANGNTYYNYYFSAKKCKTCPMRDKCRVGKSKGRTYSVTCANDAHKARLEFESSEEFSDKLRIRHRIEEKNGEMKTAHGLRRADSVAGRKILCKRFSTKSRMALENRADSGLNSLITESHGGQSGMRAGTA